MSVNDGGFEAARVGPNARRLHTVLTTLLEDVMFDLPDMAEKKIVIDPARVGDRLKDIVEDEDLRKYIL